MRTTEFPQRKLLPYLVGAMFTTAIGVVPCVQAETAALEEIIVTAQKRDESLQDVPIAITALTQEALETNRVANVSDLSGLAPNLAVRPAAGGTQIASFSMRGITSFGVVPGSDKEISIYLDGVYVGSPRGSIFNLPDVAQLEVLRGPQGTLFGRNATAGAINITTRDPSGELALRQELSFGNQDYQRTRTTIESPTWGPFSFLVTYANEERDGDIKNNVGDIVWDRSAFNAGTAHVPKRFGDKDAETYFFATRFEPSDIFTMTYKFDHSVDHGTPGANVAAAINSDGLGLLAFNPLTNTATGLTAANLPPLAANFKRPDSATDTFLKPLDQENTGHSLTTVIDATDSVSVKNITAYRKSELSAATDLTGLGGLTVGGAPYCFLGCNQSDNDADQWSTELQVNYEADLFTLTVGALYFESDERAGYTNAATNILFAAFPGYVIPAGNQATSYNEAQSLAGYTQLEYHLNDDIDLVGGWRWTRDRKNGDFVQGTEPAETHKEFRYEDSRPSWTLGVNYKPTYGTLVYGKYSEAFVSGGAVADLPFETEVAKSWEAGIKADLFESTVRTNLSVFNVTYEHVQSAQGGSNVGRPDLSTVIVDQGGDTEAWGFEWEGSAALGYGVTLNASTGYTDVEIKDVSPVLLNSVQGNVYPGSSYEATLIPDWTGNLALQYESDPLFEQAYLAFNVGGQWHSKISMEANPAREDNNPSFLQDSPAGWIVNSRLALKDIDVGFAGGLGEIGLWGRNLTDNDDPNFALNVQGLVESASFGEARSYGVDFIVQF